MKQVQNPQTVAIRWWQRLAPRHLLLLWCCLILPCQKLCAGPYGPLGPTATVSEFPPDIPWNGRIDSIALTSYGDQFASVSSEEGGVFYSLNGGRKWHHSDGFPSFRAKAVAFVPGTPTLIATSGTDGRQPSSGGIWVSPLAGGSGWTKPVTSTPITSTPSGSPSCSSAFEAYGIATLSKSGKIFVATSCGLALSDDLGNTWTHSMLPSGARAEGVAALSDKNIVVNASDGVFFSSDGGGTWNPSKAKFKLPFNNGFGRYAISPLGDSDLDVAAVSGTPSTGYELYFSHDGGNNWVSVKKTPTGADNGCGGIPFVKVSPIVNSLPDTKTRTVFVGNQCAIYRTVCTTRTTGTTCDDWYAYTEDLKRIPHSDTRDLAFSPVDGSPLFVGTDGGLGISKDGGESFVSIGGPRTSGLNALMVTEAFGQQIQDIARHDLYFSTQDTELWASGNDGASWPFKARAEGFYFMGPSRVATESESEFDVTTCAKCEQQHYRSLFKSKFPFFRFSIDGNQATEAWRLAAPESYVQLEGLNSGEWKMRATRNRGSSWSGTTNLFSPVLLAPTPSFEIPLSRVGFYIPIKDTSGTSRNLLALGTLSSAASATDPPKITYSLGRNLGSIGMHPTMFAWYPVYAVDPADTRHIIAADVVRKDVRQSIDSGNTWDRIDSLSTLAYDGFQNWVGAFPPITTVSFSPQDPSIVLAGSLQGGIFLSEDRGTNWVKLEGTEKVTRVSSFHWVSLNEILVTSYGRGLWKIGLSPKISYTKVFEKCKEGIGLICSGFPLQSLGAGVNSGYYDIKEMSEIALASEGRITMIKKDSNGKLYVTTSSGTSIQYFADGELPSSVVFSNQDDLPNGSPLPEFAQIPENTAVVGLGFKARQPVALLLANGMLPLEERMIKPVEPISGARIPQHVNKPQLQVYTRIKEKTLGRTFSPNEPLIAVVSNVSCNTGRERLSFNLNDVSTNFIFKSCIRGRHIYFGWAPGQIGIYKVTVARRIGRDQSSTLATDNFSVVPGDGKDPSPN